MLPSEFKIHKNDAHPSDDHNATPSCTIKLFSWILDMSESSFSISTDETQTVDDLKEAILK
jgi:hypothetical protein